MLNFSFDTIVRHFSFHIKMVQNFLLSKNYVCLYNKLSVWQHAWFSVEIWVFNYHFEDVMQQTKLSFSGCHAGEGWWEIQFIMICAPAPPIVTGMQNVENMQWEVSFVMGSICDLKY